MSVDDTFNEERGTGLMLQTRPELATTGTVTSDVNRQIAEIQAMVIVAQRCPRNTVAARERILAAFTRPNLAKAAMYQYPRGKETVTGPSIRAAEAMALSWGNMKFGIREIEQRYGESTMYAYAWDLETNVVEDRTFQVSHKIATRRGTKTLEDPRDIYENNANLGARRMRACILAVLPIDIIEDTISQVQQTLRASVKITPELVTSLVEKFEAIGVPKQALEGYMRSHLDIKTLTPGMVIRLSSIFNSITDGVAVPTDYFDIAPPVDAEAPASRVEQAVELLERRKREGQKDAGAIETPFDVKGPAIKKALCRACGRVQGEPHAENCPIDETDEADENAQ